MHLLTSIYLSLFGFLPTDRKNEHPTKQLISRESKKKILFSSDSDRDNRGKTGKYIIFCRCVHLLWQKSVWPSIFTEYVAFISCGNLRRASSSPPLLIFCVWWKRTRFLAFFSKTIKRACPRKFFRDSSSLFYAGAGTVKKTITMLYHTCRVYYFRSK